eukprot:CAMPEP_0172574622 /NCGR_PEP_ID=MMETSP1067-20121228/136768_1 /TAXON_ID=265564 ORGANISM="Thalassiosira punctigera, Strain Tpunct2005C2" /NCGR_SAMPLE_ID=MMETSP1067 /ASSEMBLY_ACC=CAM_ASM_000444 /LENGTH=70 /DNA_ID=CAMNT_0013367255 /DNA_START=7032 /DNA_END=7244 /DNA_ORIENTATION=-
MATHLISPTLMDVPRACGVAEALRASSMVHRRWGVCQYNGTNSPLLQVTTTSVQVLLKPDAPVVFLGSCR